MCKSFGGLHALTEADLSLAPHRVLGIIGPNGAGKSTLVNVLGGQLHADRGAVTFAGEDVTRLDPARRARLGISRTFQHTKVLSSFDVRGALRLAMAAPRARKMPLYPSVDSICEVFRLGPHLETPMTDLPYGMQKFLNLCLVAVSNPVVALLDEPFAGVTASDIDILVEVIEAMREHGVAIALIEHDMRTLMKLSDEVLVIDAGRTVASGPPEEIRRSELVRRIYLGTTGDAVA